MLPQHPRGENEDLLPRVHDHPRSVKAGVGPTVGALPLLLGDPRTRLLRPVEGAGAAAPRKDGLTVSGIVFPTILLPPGDLLLMFAVVPLEVAGLRGLPRFHRGMEWRSSFLHG